MNDAIQSIATSALEYIPDSVRDATGFNKQILEEVQHIVDIKLDHVAWLNPQKKELFLVLAYVDGFQVWTICDKELNGREIVSIKLDKAIALVKVLPLNNEQDTIASGPLVAFIQKNESCKIKIYSVVQNDSVYLLRSLQPVQALSATKRMFAVGLHGQIDLYDARNFTATFSVATLPTPNKTTSLANFALGERWLA